MGSTTKAVTWRTTGFSCSKPLLHTKYSTYLCAPGPDIGFTEVVQVALLRFTRLHAWNRSVVKCLKQLKNHGGDRQKLYAYTNSQLEAWAPRQVIERFELFVQ